MELVSLKKNLFEDCTTSQEDFQNASFIILTGLNLPAQIKSLAKTNQGFININFSLVKCYEFKLTIMSNPPNKLSTKLKIIPPPFLQEASKTMQRPCVNESKKYNHPNNPVGGKVVNG